MVNKRAEREKERFRHETHWSANPGERDPMRGPREKWIDTVEENLRNTVVDEWREILEDRERWW